MSAASSAGQPVRGGRNGIGTVQHAGRLHGILGWADVRHRHAGSVAFLTNRVTGLLLIGYLYLHLGVLYLLTEGSGSWASVLHLFKNRGFLALESLLILSILVHGLNGLRLGLSESSNDPHQGRAGAGP
jgi:succinate dehydrogenase hydrophobic anchor subunit